MKRAFKDALALLDKLKVNELFIHELEDEYRAEVFEAAGRFDDFFDTHYLMHGDKVVWIGTLYTLEHWVNAHY